MTDDARKRHRTQFGRIQCLILATVDDDGNRRLRIFNNGVTRGGHISGNVDGLRIERQFAIHQRRKIGFDCPRIARHKSRKS